MDTTSEQYMQDLIILWEAKLHNYQKYINETTGDTAAALEDEVVRLQAKITQMHDRLASMEQQLNDKLKRAKKS